MFSEQRSCFEFTTSFIYVNLDYLEMSENQINSLMMRYETLHATNEGLVTDLEGNATQVCVRAYNIVRVVCSFLVFKHSG